MVRNVLRVCETFTQLSNLYNFSTDYYNGMVIFVKMLKGIRLRNDLNGFKSVPLNCSLKTEKKTAIEHFAYIQMQMLF